MYMKLITSFSNFINESETPQNAMEFWFVVSEDQIVAVYDNLKNAKSYYESEVETKKDLYFDQYVDDQEDMGRNVVDYGIYVHSDGGYMNPPELTITDEEYDEYFEDNYGDQIYLSGPHNLSELPKDIQSLMTPQILEDILEYGAYEL